MQSAQQAITKKVQRTEAWNSAHELTPVLGCRNNPNTVWGLAMHHCFTYKRCILNNWCLSFSNFSSFILKLPCVHMPFSDQLSHFALHNGITSMQISDCFDISLARSGYFLTPKGNKIRVLDELMIQLRQSHPPTPMPSTESLFHPESLIQYCKSLVTGLLTMTETSRP